MQSRIAHHGGLPPRVVVHFEGLLPRVAAVAGCLLTLVASPLLADEPTTVKLHVHASGAGHIHVAGGSINSVSASSGSVVTVVAGGGTTTSEADLAVELQNGGVGTFSLQEDSAANAAWFSRYCHSAHEVAPNVVFTTVATGVQVVPKLSDGAVALTVTPFISYHSPTGTGTIVFHEATSQSRLSSGQSLSLHAPSSKTKLLYRNIFGTAFDSGLMQITPEIKSQ